MNNNEGVQSFNAIPLSKVKRLKLWLKRFEIIQLCTPVIHYELFTPSFCEDFNNNTIQNATNGVKSVNNNFNLCDILRHNGMITIKQANYFTKNTEQKFSLKMKSVHGYACMLQLECQRYNCKFFLKFASYYRVTVNFNLTSNIEHVENSKDAPLIITFNQNKPTRNGSWIQTIKFFSGDNKYLSKVVLYVNETFHFNKCPCENVRIVQHKYIERVMIFTSQQILLYPMYFKQINNRQCNRHFHHQSIQTSKTNFVQGINVDALKWNKEKLFWTVNLKLCLSKCIAEEFMKKPTCWTEINLKSANELFMKQFCNHSGLKDQCSFNNSIEYHDLSIQCSYNGTKKQFYDRQLNCQWIKQKYRPPVILRHITESQMMIRKTIKVGNHFMSKANWKRICPLGYYREMYINTTECMPCPPDHFADESTSAYKCNACPMRQSTTNGISGAISIHCLANQNQKINRRFLRKRDILLRVIKRSIQPVSGTTEEEDIKEHLMKWLQPDEERLKLQDDAISIFKELNCLGFSSHELFLMIIISIGIAWFGICLTFILFLSVQEPFGYQVDERKYAKRKSKLTKISDSIVNLMLFFLESVLCFPFHLCYGIKRRTSNVAFKFKKNDFLLRLSTVKRETMNIFRQELIYHELFEMKQTTMLQDILTDLTTDRIIEANQVEQMEKSLSQWTSGSITTTTDLNDPDDRCENSIITKRVQRNCDVMKPYFRIPRRYNPAYFLFHTKFWRQFSRPRSRFNAPFYPLQIKREDLRFNFNV
ncbi:unnamed protein product [Trichobilharzia szidati]|nr:unnamed protein product [Trichobilharzia szidati]